MSSAFQRLSWLALLCIECMAIGTLLQEVRAADYTWSSPNGLFNDALNWMPKVVPGVNDRAIFGVPANFTDVVMWDDTTGHTTNLDLLVQNGGTTIFRRTNSTEFLSHTVTSQALITGGSRLQLGYLDVQANISDPLDLNATTLTIHSGAELLSVESIVAPKLLSVAGTVQLSEGSIMQVGPSGDADFAGGFLSIEDGSAYFVEGSATSVRQGGQIAIGHGGMIGSNSTLFVGGSVSGPDGLGNLSLNESTASVNMPIYVWDQGRIDVTAGSIDASDLGIFVGASGGGIVSIVGTNSAVTASNSVVGLPSQGGPGQGQNPATLSVLDGGSFVSAQTTLLPSAAINIDGGYADLGIFQYGGGSLNFLAGELSLTGDLDVGTNGILGQNLNLSDERRLILTGTTTIDPFRKLTINGGSPFNGRTRKQRRYTRLPFWHLEHHRRGGTYDRIGRPNGRPPRLASGSDHRGYKRNR